MDMQEITNLAPEAGEGIIHLLQDAVGILLTVNIGGELLVAAFAAVLGQGFLGDGIVGLQGRVVLTDIVPDLGGILHDPDDILPFLVVLLAQDLCPQVGVLVDRCLCSGNTRINIDLAVLDEAVGLAVGLAEEHRLTFQHVTLHLLGDPDGVQSYTVIGFLSLDCRDVHIFDMNSPLLTVLVHEARKYLIIEYFHSITTYTEVITLKDTFFENLRGKILTDELRKLIRLHSLVNIILLVINNTIYESTSQKLLGFLVIGNKVYLFG